MLEPISSQDWDAAKASHLLLRAGFGATTEDVNTALKAGCAQTVTNLLSFQNVQEAPPGPAWVNDPIARMRPTPKKDIKSENLPPEEIKKLLQARNREEMIHMAELRGWWINRMLTSPWPLQEKLTLFWHGHFATSFEKVKFPYLMYLQNQTLRSFAVGNWQEMLVAVSKDPAMLIYLDNAKSFSGAPNENYARELMELFTLGEGNYTENDIQQSARAFTGWSITPETGAFTERPFRHDRGDKTFMGETGSFDGSDIIRIIVKQPQAAHFIMKKVWTFFAYEKPEPELMDELAATFTKNSMNFATTLETIFLSKAFYSDKAIRQQIKSPAVWLTGFLKSSGAPAPHFSISQQMLAQLGQALFQPPNVKGWDGGLAWITAASLVDRYRFNEALIRGGGQLKGFLGPVRQVLEAQQNEKMMAPTSSPEMTLTNPETPPMNPEMQMSPDIVINQLSKPTVDPDKIFLGLEQISDEPLLNALVDRFFHTSLRPQDKARMLTSIPQGKVGAQFSREERIRAILAVVNTPQYQLT